VKTKIYAYYIKHKSSPKQPDREGIAIWGKIIKISGIFSGFGQYYIVRGW